MMKNSPGPTAPSRLILPNRKITARSYSYNKIQIVHPRIQKAVMKFPYLNHFDAKTE